MPPALSLAIRQKILAVAGELFFRHGFRAVGVDTIVAAAGVAKMTLYRHFPSKDDLIVAYLEQVNHLMLDWLAGAIQPLAGKPRAQLLAIFKALDKLVSSPQCMGCAFLMAAAEFPELDSPSHQAALAHKHAVRGQFRELAHQAGAPQPDLLAGQLLLIMDGAFAEARLFGPRPRGAGAAEAAAALLAAQLPA
jgi:AcrR family transcriptional regulator